MPDYMPSTRSVRIAYVFIDDANQGIKQERQEAFDRWYEAEKRKWVREGRQDIIDGIREEADQMWQFETLSAADLHDLADELEERNA